MRILIVDDQDNIRRTLRALLESEGYVVSEADRAESALADLDDTAPDAVLLDLALPGMNGLQALDILRERAPSVPVVMMSGQASLAEAVEATRRGAYHFIEKPLTPEGVLLTLRRALELSRARDLTRALQKELGPDARLVGESRQIAELRTLIERVAPTEARVLITGESGTGKELVAAAIHGLSPRREGPFVRVNSAAIPRDLVESEMFGHEQGAFTGATERRRGRFELASGGTLFLDEVGDLGAEAQAKLLRAVESGVIERVGGSVPIPVDVRLISATNRRLEALVDEGRFRDDLRFRLSVVPVHVPPLRERAGDVALLVDHALDRLRAREGVATPAMSREAIDVFEDHDWPGNVRELMNAVERLAILHGARPIGAAEAREVVGPRRSMTHLATRPATRPDMPHTLLDALGTLRADAGLNEHMDAVERALIEEALTACGRNVARAARRLRTDRANLYRRMRRLGIDVRPDVSK